MATFPSGTALITGASVGIGRAFAQRAAADGADLVLVARREDALQELAADLRERFDIRVAVIPADLSLPGAAAALVAEVETRGLQIDTLVNNAGLGAHGNLAVTDVALASTQIAVNITALTELTALLLPGMLERNTGAIITIASTAAFQPVPHFAVYAATKAYVRSFTIALWGELHGTGVRALAVCPGATSTEFFAVAGASGVGTFRTPEQVVGAALRALHRGKASVVDGAMNAFTARIAQRLPERLATAIAERAMRV